RAARPAAIELAPGDVGRVPDLLGDQMPVAREALERREQARGRGALARGELVVRALAREQRPRPPDAGAVEGRAVLVLAVAVAVVAAPARPRGQIDAQQRVDHANGVAD